MTIVTVHSAITGRPVPGGTLDTSTTNFPAAISKALSFPEVQRADMADRLAAQDALEALFTGGYPYRGRITDPRFAKYGISHVTVEESVTEAPEEVPATDTPIYEELSSPSPAPLSFMERDAVKSQPSDFVPASKGWRIRHVAAVYAVAGFVAGVVVGGVIF